jgi:hypothetical protein
LVQEKKERLKRMEQRLGDQQKEIKNGLDEYGALGARGQNQEIIQEGGENYGKE